MIEENILEVRNLKKYYIIEKGFRRKQVGIIKAVDNVSFSIRYGETVGLVGESGCGKTTIAKCILKAIDTTEGEIILYEDKNKSIDIVTMPEKELRYHRKNIQMIFQDPYASLSPRMTVLDIISETLKSLKLVEPKNMRTKVMELMDQVGLDRHFINRYPHAFSGGQRQRIGIARALASNPRLIIADEPVSALDVSVQAQILNLIKDIKEERSLSMLFISHNLSVIRHICDRVLVMYMGHLVESAYTDPLYDKPLHPYTQALLKAIPDFESTNSFSELSGDIPDPSNLPPGCPFNPRCPKCTDICKTESPPIEEIETGHYISCHNI
jgi:oligopeptide/dipeptide ABC transporter ATP-binding protein